MESPSWVPTSVAAHGPVPDGVLAATEIDWRPAGATTTWLGCRAGIHELADILRDCGAVEFHETGVEDGRSAVAVPVGAGWVVQIRASTTDGVVEQVGSTGASPSGPRARVGAVRWARPVCVGAGWVVRRLRAADVLAQWVAAGALPPLSTTAFLEETP
ncbi:MAG TPA: hypothetical protein VGC37_18725 [Friedmanniella sp.]